eukprot:1136219-Pelagomonas_calceolata.AAC.3
MESSTGCQQHYCCTTPQPIHRFILSPKCPSTNCKFPCMLITSLLRNAIGGSMSFGSIQGGVALQYSADMWYYGPAVDVAIIS